MRPPLYTTLRAFGIGATAGSLAAIPLGLAAACLGQAGFYGACLLIGASAIAASFVLERRARRASNGEETK